MNGDIWTIVATILTGIGTIATVISTVAAVRAKNEARDILKQIKEEQSRNIENSGNIRIKNNGINKGIMNALIQERHGNDGGEDKHSEYGE